MPQALEGIKALIFDLDDTLIETSRILIPQAIRDSCEKMILAGLNSTVEECIAWREEWNSKNPRSDFFEALVLHFGVRSTKENVLKSGRQAFYNRKIVGPLPRAPGVDLLLERAKDRFLMFLVTAGSPPTQSEKLEKAELSNHFSQLLFVDPVQLESKGEAFQEILRMYKLEPGEVMSIGDRVDHEIAVAKSLGMRTCWIAQGDHSTWLPSLPNEFPDLQFKNMTEFVEKCLPIKS